MTQHYKINPFILYLEFPRVRKLFPVLLCGLPNGLLSLLQPSLGQEPLGGFWHHPPQDNGQESRDAGHPLQHPPIWNVVGGEGEEEPGADPGELQADAHVGLPVAANDLVQREEVRIKHNL